MKQIGSVTTGMALASQKPTGQQHGETGSPVQPLAPLPESKSSNVSIPSPEDLQPLLMKPLTSLTLSHSRDEQTGKNYMTRQHTLQVPLAEARRSYSMLMAATSVGERKDVSSLLKALSVLPTQRASGGLDAQAEHDAISGQLYLMAVEGMPYASISHAVQYYTFKRGDGVFRPVPGVFRKTVEDHAKSIKLKLKHLAEAIANEEGER